MKFFFFRKLIFGKAKPNSLQLKAISKILFTMGQLFFGSAVIGFFIPGTSGEVTKIAFVLGLTTSIICFIFSIRVLKTTKRE